jgi:hypothetical protein
MPAWILLGLAAAALVWLILRRPAARARTRIASGQPDQGFVPVTSTGDAKSKTTPDEGGHDDGGTDGGDGGGGSD